nr:zinc finger BED domain-containing protein 5-like [Onthophagus taurus]
MDKWLKKASEKQPCVEVSAESTSGTECVDTEEIPSKIRKVIRKYDANYISIGFTVTEVKNEPRPQCVVCFEILSNQCMKPSLLKRHLTTKHSTLENKPKEYFLRKLNEMKISKKIMSSFTSSTQKGVQASFLASLRIAQCGKAHTIGEELLLPAAKDMVNCILGENAAKQVRRRVDAMASNVKNILIDRIRSSDFFAIQLDESTDVTNYAQLMVYVRYLFNTEIKEDYLFCTTLSTHTTADEIFKNLNEFFEEIASIGRNVWVFVLMVLEL